MSIIVEIRAAEGGEHSKILVREQFEIYCRLAIKRGIGIELLDEREGIIVFKATGDDNLFYNETGGHRYQQISPTDKNKRVHTSTITVSALPEITEQQLSIKDSELEWKTCRGSGKGGQNRNKRDTAVQVRHIPTDLMVRCESERSQWQNKNTALELLRAKLWEQKQRTTTEQRVNERKEQVGSGMRGDKRRTIRYQDGQVVDHVSGKRWRLKDYLKGEW